MGGIHSAGGGSDMQRKWSAVATGMLGLALVAIAATPGFSQAVYGSIYGTVTDQSGAVIPGARVTVTSLGQGITVEAVSNASGNYVVSHLIPGRYSVRVEAPNFKAYLAETIQVFADVSSRVDAKLELGAVSETIIVSAEDVPLLKTDRADVATLFTEKAVTELPIFDRNFTQFTLLAPGTQRLGWQHASSENPQGSIQVMVNGQHFAGTSFQLDGTDNRDPILGIIVINPTLESITQTKVTTQNYDAEFGQALAGVVTAQTKSGTNELHGSAFWFRRNDLAQARDPFTQSVPDPVTGRLLPESLWTQFGGSLGGPIVKDKVFLFGDYQGTRRSTGNSVLTTVPTNLVRNTCLAGLGCDLSEYGVDLYDPATGDPIAGTGRDLFSGAFIPAGRISSQAVALLRQLPAPNRPGIQNNFSTGGGENFDDDAFNIRGDYHPAQNLHVFGRYSLADFERSAPGAFRNNVGGPGLGDGGFAGQALSRNQSVASGFDYVLSPALLTDFRFGWFRYKVDVLPNGVGTSPAADAGIPGLNVDDFFTSGMPAMLMGFPLAPITFGFDLVVNACNCPLKQDEDQFQFVNNWTFISGNHSIKFGADIRRAFNLRVSSDAHRAGALFYLHLRTADIGGAGGGLGLATYLLGDVSLFFRFVGNPQAENPEERQNRWFFYGQDTWRISPKWTLNYGLRWEILFPESVDRDGGGGFVDINTGLVRVAGIGPIGRNGNVENTYKNLAPRLGLAFQATEKTVIRLGYGRSFDVGVFGSTFGHVVTNNLPVLAIQQLFGPTGAPWQAAFNLATGPSAFDFSPFSPGPDGTFPLPDGVISSIRPLKMRLPTVDQWNLTVQHQITPTLSFQVAYVGNKGTHVFAGDESSYDINQPTLVGFPAVPTNDRKPFFSKFGWSQFVSWFGNDADNHYNALQVKVEKRYFHGLQFLAHYTWSNALGFDGDYFIHDARLNYGPASFDRTHVFVFQNIWDIPVGRGKWFLNNANAAVNRILGGWQLNTITTWMSGMPFSPTYRDGGVDRDTGPDRPDLVGNPGVSDQSRDGWFATSGTTGLATGETGGPWRRPQPGTFGSASRNSLRGPEFFQTDLGLLKTVQVGEKVTVQFRAEAFNIFNIVNLGLPDPCVDCNPATDGKIFGIAEGAQMRNWQWGLRLRF